jgi:hypothetical protein
MAERSRDTGGASGVGDGGHPLDGPNSAGVPRWVKVFGLVLAVLVVLAALVMLLSGGAHGPGRHLSLALSGAVSPSSMVAAISLDALVLPWGQTA